MIKRYKRQQFFTKVDDFDIQKYLVRSGFRGIRGRYVGDYIRDDGVGVSLSPHYNGESSDDTLVCIAYPNKMGKEFTRIKKDVSSMLLKTARKRDKRERNG